MATINKVKPFFIRITEDMTPQIIQDALDKCVDAGAIALDRAINTNAKHDYKVDMFINNWGYFGVDIYGSTLFFYGLSGESDGRKFGGMQNEITLDQLDAHLGIESEVEWKNGDACEYYYNEGEEWRDGAYVILDNGFHVVRDLEDDGYTGVTKKHLRKPETPEQREERERLEAAYDLYCEAYTSLGKDPCISIDTFMVNENLKTQWLAIVDKTNYRKS